MPKSFGIGFVIGASLAPTVTSVFSTVEQKIKASSTRLDALTARQQTLARADQLRAQTHNLQGRFAAGGGADPLLRAELQKTMAKYQEARAAADKYGVAVADYGREHAKATREIARTEAAMGRLSKLKAGQERRRDLRGQAMEAIVPLMATAAPIKLAMDFEYQMATVGAVARASKEEVTQLSAEARRLGATTMFSASQAGQGMEYLAMAGFKTNQIISAMPGVLDLAAAGNADLARTADIASDILTGFGLKADQMTRVADVLANTFTSSNTNLEMLGDTMKYVAPVAAKAGLSLEQTAAMAGLMANVGIKASMSGTAMRAGLLRLVAPPKQAQAAIQALVAASGEDLGDLAEGLEDVGGQLQELGIRIKDGKGNMRQMPDILEDLARATARMGSADKLEVMKKIFGTEAASAWIEMLTQATKTVDDEGKKIVDAQGRSSTALRQMIAANENASGATARIAAEKMNTAKGAWLTLKSAAEEVGIAFGTALLPAFNATAGGLTAVAGGVGRLIAAFPTATPLIAGVAVGLMALKVAAIGGAYAWSLLSGGYTIASGAVTFFTTATARARAVMLLQSAATGVAAAAQWGLNAAMTANPIGLIVAAVVALVGGMVWLYNTCEPVRAVFDAVFGYIGQKIAWVWDKIKALGSGLKALGKYIGLGGDDGQSQTPSGASRPKAAAAVSTPQASMPPGLDSPPDMPQLPPMPGASSGGGLSFTMPITINGVTDADFGRRVSTALESRKSDIERIITDIVNDQMRLAYGG